MKSLPPDMEFIAKFAGLSFDEIVKEVEARHRVSGLLEYGGRRSEMVRARDELVYVLKHGLDYSLERIGRETHRDHSSVLAAIRRFERKKGPDGVKSVVMGIAE